MFLLDTFSTFDFRTPAAGVAAAAHTAIVTRQKVVLVWQLAVLLEELVAAGSKSSVKVPAGHTQC